MTTTFLITRGDVTINRSSGQPRLIADAEKLPQDLRIALATEARADNVGVGIEDVINGQAASASVVEWQIQRRTRAAVQTMQDLQNRYNTNQRPRTERLVSLAYVQVTTVANDPTAYYFRAAFQSGSRVSDPLVLGGRIA